MLIELPPVITSGDVDAFKAAIVKRLRADDGHATPRAGHVLEVKTGNPCEMRCVRTECSCGWVSEWRRSTPA